jgi:protein-disulfide isomerase-like protein with CxxC motif
VDELLGELMSELGVTEEQFMEACEKASANQLHKKIVDQITAVDNFSAFKKLLVKRN